MQALSATCAGIEAYYHMAVRKIANDWSTALPIVRLSTNAPDAEKKRYRHHPFGGLL
jgi:hypothetical protein